MAAGAKKLLAEEKQREKEEEEVARKKSEEDKRKKDRGGYQIKYYRTRKGHNSRSFKSETRSTRQRRVHSRTNQ